jgi:hypothetical protein
VLGEIEDLRRIQNRDEGLKKKRDSVLRLAKYEQELLARKTIEIEISINKHIDQIIYDVNLELVDPEELIKDLKT